MQIFIDIIINKTVEVLFALLPLLIIFIIFQFIKIKLPRAQFVIVLRGLFLTFVGLVLFLSGVDIGFIYMGDLIGQTLGQLTYNWILIPIGFVLGFVVTIAEPAIQVLIIEVEKVTAGSINRKIILYFLSFGVAVAVALSMLRMINNISLWYFVLPGYLIILIVMWFVSPIFVSIAFDSGGVVTGPMIATFLLSLTVGSSTVILGSDPLTDAFGMIALVAMVPIFSILVLGILYSKAEAKAKEQARINAEKEKEKEFVLLGVFAKKEYMADIVQYFKNVEFKGDNSSQESYSKVDVYNEVVTFPEEIEKEMLFKLIEKGKVNDIIRTIQKKIFLDDSKEGLLFTLDMDKVAEICYLYHSKKRNKE
jgi:hypothetical protein